MTKQELKDYLNTSYTELENLKLNIKSLEYYKQHVVAKFPPYLMKTQSRQLDQYITEDRKRIEQRTAQLVAWSEMIHKDLYRQIFIDHYIHGLKWSDIEEKYHYSRSRIFEINKLCCGIIARQTVCDIVPNCQQEAVTI